ncbi:MAG: cytochrome c [Flavobacteriaceae bacterium]|nr:cytochrome c [Flavobacteriaceae bacterium]
MRTISKFIFLLSTMLLLGCTNDSESDLIDPVDPDGPVTYNANIRAIINNNCLGCHSDPPQNGAPFPLTNYDQVLARAQNGQLLRAIRRQTGEPRAMPPSGRLPQATIDLVAQWIEDGLNEQ